MKINFLKNTKLVSSLVVLLFVVAVSSCSNQPPIDGPGGGGVVIDDPTFPGDDGKGENPDDDYPTFPGDDDGKEEPPVENPGDDKMPEDPANPDVCSFEGELFWPVDGCNLSIKLSDNTSLYPVNQDKLAGLKIGDRIKFGYVYRHEVVTNCMSGYNIEIKCMQVISSNNN